MILGPQCCLLLRPQKEQANIRFSTSQRRQDGTDQCHLGPHGEPATSLASATMAAAAWHAAFWRTMKASRVDLVFAFKSASSCRWLPCPAAPFFPLPRYRAMRPRSVGSRASHPTMMLPCGRPVAVRRAAR